MSKKPSNPDQDPQAAFTQWTDHWVSPGSDDQLVDSDLKARLRKLDIPVKLSSSDPNYWS
jgi:hypothetical protein